MITAPMLSVFFMIINLLKEIVQIKAEGKYYITDGFNWVDIIVYILVSIC